MTHLEQKSKHNTVRAGNWTTADSKEKKGKVATAAVAYNSDKLSDQLNMLRWWVEGKSGCFMAGLKISWVLSQSGLWTNSPDDDDSDENDVDNDEDDDSDFLVIDQQRGHVSTRVWHCQVPLLQMFTVVVVVVVVLSCALSTNPSLRRAAWTIIDN